MSDDATLDKFAEDNTESSADWKTVKLEEIVEKRAENVDPRQVDVSRHVGLEHIHPNTPVPSWESVEGLSSTKRRFQAGDILFAKLRPNLEKSAQPDFDGIASTDTFPIIAADRTNSKYLLYRLSSKPAYDHARRTSVGTRMPRTSWNLFSNFEFKLPPLSEQRKIATVLHTVDQAIQKTKEVIEQTERTQKGHIRHLFRKGVSDEATETHEVLGETPTSWQITELSNIADVVMGSSPKSEYYNESGDGLPFYQGNNDFNRRNPTTNVWCTDPVKQAKKGDILISIRAPVGDLNIATEDCCIGRGLAAIRPQSIDFDYLYYHLYERNNWFSRIGSGSTFDSINSSQIRNTKIKLPSKSIQEKIGSILRNNELYILKEEEYLNQLQRLKQGLMQDLLSGEVRTIDVDIDVPEEVAQYG